MWSHKQKLEAPFFSFLPSCILLHSLAWFLWPEGWGFSRSCSCLCCHCTVLCNLGCPQGKVAGEKREQNNQIPPPPALLLFRPLWLERRGFFWGFSLPVLLPCSFPTGTAFKAGLGKKKREVVSLHMDIPQQHLSLVLWPEGRGFFCSFCCPLSSCCCLHL